MISVTFGRAMRHVTILSVGSLCAIACQSDKITTVSTQSASETAYWALQNNMPAVTVAVDGQQRLSVVPITKSGSVITTLPTPTFTSADPTKVTVDANGVVKGVAETPGVSVVSSLTADGVTYVDTTNVAVTTQSAVVKSLKIDAFPAGTLLGLGDPSITLFPIALDENDQPIPGVAISVTTLDPKVVLIYSFGGPPSVQTSTLGKARIVASTTSYGVTKADTVEFTVQYGMQGRVAASIYPPNTPVTFNPSAILIGIGGTVTWSNYTNAPLAITFQNGLENIPGGNISGIDLYQQETRQFLAAGTYNFTAGDGSTGQVIVREQPTF